jgi:peroxiredoxin
MNKAIGTLAAAGLLAAGLWLSTASPVLRAQEENTPAPAFNLKDLNGVARSLEGYRGKVLVVNFWATWCPPCRAEIPDFIDAYASLKDRGLEILGLSVDRMPADKLSEWARQAGVNYPLALATGRVLADYRPGEYIPATIIIDRNGNIRYRHVGQMDKSALLRLFEDYAR